MKDKKPFRIMFVCMGNICRSPLAHGIFEDLIEKAGLADFVSVESSGTVSSHVGELPDPRMRDEAAIHGIVLDHRARQIQPDDIEKYDLILGMDRSNIMNIKYLCKKRISSRSHIKLFRSFDPEGGTEVPDPYYGGPEGFSRVYAIVERTCRTLLESVKARYLKEVKNENT